MFKNHYQTLGVSRSASHQEIKTAYKKLAKKFHPDKNNGDNYFEERFKEILEAYEVLTDLHKKEKYDIKYDSFFNGQHKESSQQNTRKENPKPDFQEPDKDRVKRDREEAEKKEKERVANIKRNEELQFEDKAWIFVGNWMIPGILGIWMFIKYSSEGYTKKSNTVCSLTIFSLIALFIFTIILVLAGEAGR